MISRARRCGSCKVSPVPGCSILMLCAPRSPSKRPARSPVGNTVHSNTRTSRKSSIITPSLESVGDKPSHHRFFGARPRRQGRGPAERSSRDADRQALRASGERGPVLGDEPGLDLEATQGDDRLEASRHLPAGQVVAEAPVDAGTESDMAGDVLAGKVEFVRVGELCRVTVGRGPVQQDSITGLHWTATHFDVPDEGAGTCRDGGLVPEKLLDR